MDKMMQNIQSDTDIEPSDNSTIVLDESFSINDK